MRVDIVSIFPEYFAPLDLSLIGKARANGTLRLAVHDLRSWTHDVHHSVDDAPYGGGPGMVMKAPVWGEALDEICTEDTVLVIPTPAGRLFTQNDAQAWTAQPHLVFACGRYEGIDQRVAEDARRRMRVEEVSNVQVNGDDATAEVRISGGGQGESTDTWTLVRGEDRWLVCD